MAQRIVPTTPQKPGFPWLIVAIGMCYLTVMALLLFLPGASVLDRLRWLDSGICAQQPTHSFYPGGQQLPLCARNTGIYTSFFLTLITLYVTGRGRSQRLPPRPIMVVLICCVIALAIDGSNSLALDLHLPHLYQPHNLLRLATGLLTGLALAAFGLPMTNRLIWCEYNEQRSISSWQMLGYFVLLPALCFLAIASQNALILYPVALISSIGVFTLISIINLITVVALSRRDETFTRYREIAAFFSLALVLALGELSALAQLKLLLLHTLGM